MTSQLNTVIVLFARMGSTRLPGKALKLLDGTEILGSCVERLQSTCADLFVLTTLDRSDEKIAEYCKKIKVPCFRGNHSPMLRLKDFLCYSSQKYNLVIRVTADNIFPDYHLIENLISESSKREDHERYEFVAEGESGLPKGVAAEAIGVKLLYEQVFPSSDPYILEHITPTLRKKFKKRVFGREFNYHLGDLNVSIDTEDDFIKMKEFWKSDYKKIHYLDLIKKFSKFNRYIVDSQEYNSLDS